MAAREVYDLKKAPQRVPITYRDGNRFMLGYRELVDGRFGDPVPVRTLGYIVGTGKEARLELIADERV